MSLLKAACFLQAAFFCGLRSVVIVGSRSGSEAPKANTDCEASWERGVSTPLRRLMWIAKRRGRTIRLKYLLAP